MTPGTRVRLRREFRFLSAEHQGTVQPGTTRDFIVILWDPLGEFALSNIFLAHEAADLLEIIE